MGQGYYVRNAEGPHSSVMMYAMVWLYKKSNDEMKEVRGMGKGTFS